MVCLKAALPTETKYLIWQEHFNNVNDAIESDKTNGFNILTSIAIRNKPKEMYKTWITHVKSVIESNIVLLLLNNTCKDTSQ